jgi:hypothetical protein
MIFLNPKILFALSAVIIPVLIHLFNLKKIRKIEFSTLMFLKEIQKSKLKRIRIKQLILLFIRILAIVSIVLAFANPVLEGYYGINQGNVRKTGIIILDDSYSMDIKNDDGSSFDISKKYINDMLSNFSPNDNLIFLTSSKLSLKGYSPDQSGLSQILDSVKNCGIHYKVFYYDEIMKFLNNTDYLNKELIKEIFIFSDFHKINFRDINQADYIANNNYLYTINTSARNGNNISFSGLELKTKILEAGRQVKLGISIKNHSDFFYNNKVVKLFNDNILVSENAVELNPNENKIMEFSVRPNKTGLNKYHFEIVRDKYSEDELIQDNNYYFILNIPEQINLSVLSDGFQGSSNYINIALETANKFVTDSSNNNKIIFNLLASVPDNKKDVLIINNKLRFSESEKKIVRDYLNDGKGILCFSKRGMDIDDYNSLFSSLGLFKIIKSNKVENNNTDNAVDLKLKNIDLSHPIFSGVFKKEDIEDLSSGKKIESPVVNEYFTIQPNNNSIPIITFTDNNIFLIESNAGKGKFVFCSVSPDNDMSNFPMTSLFPTILIRSIQYLNSNDNEIPQYEIGKQNIISFNSTNKIDFVIAPDNKKYDFVENNIKNNTIIGKEYFMFPYSIYSQIPGFYEFIDSSGTKNQTIALNSEQPESNLEKYNEREIEEYFKKLGFGNVKYINKPEALKSVITGSRQGTDLTKYFLLLALILIIAEILYAKYLEKK